MGRHDFPLNKWYTNTELLETSSLRKVYANVTEPPNAFLARLVDSKKRGSFSKQNTPVNTTVTTLNRLTDAFCRFFPQESSKQPSLHQLTHVCIICRRSQYHPVSVQRLFPYLHSDTEISQTSWRKLPQLSWTLKSEQRDASLRRRTYSLLWFMSSQNMREL